MRFFIIAAFMMILLACSSQKENQEQSPRVAGPQVQNWMNTVKAEAETRLPVIVTTTKPVADSLLKEISPNHYTARLSPQELKVLLNNPAVKRISTGKEKLH